MKLRHDSNYRKLMRLLAQEEAIDVFDEQAVAQASREMAQKGLKEQEKLRKDVARIWEKYEQELQATS